MILQITANLIVDRIEPSIPFFDRIGFSMDVQVPEDDHIGFAIFINGENQVMFQTRQSLREDSDAFMPAANATGPSLLFITVDDVEAIAEKLADYEVVMPMRDTFYGAKEISFLEPGGHVMTFAQFGEEKASG